MYSILYKIFFALKREEKKINNSQSIRLVVIKWLIGYIEAYYNIFVVKFYKKHGCKKRGITTKKRNQRIIVSLTTFPKRINTVWITIETLLRQSMKPDEIILWLAEEQFAGLETLPIELLEQQRRGLTIRFCDDLRSHKKYYYVMQEYPKDIIILVDDDMFYPRDTIKRLWNMHLKYPQNICCMTVQVMEPSFKSLPSSWRNPEIKEKIENSNRVQIFTGSGSLFVPGVLSEELFEKELLLKLCPYADDLWITFMAYRKRTRITSSTYWRAFPISIYGTEESGLWYINSCGGKNDEQWVNILNFFQGENGLLCNGNKEKEEYDS